MMWPKADNTTVFLENQILVFAAPWHAALIENVREAVNNKNTCFDTQFSPSPPLIQQAHCVSGRFRRVFSEGLRLLLLGWEKRKEWGGERAEGKTFPSSSVAALWILHVEVLMGVRCSPNHSSEAGNVSDPVQAREERRLQELW